MSGPNRYEPSFRLGIMVEDRDGEYVRYADYAAMLDAQRALTHKAERDRDVLGKVVDSTLKTFQYQISPAEYAALARCTPASKEEA